MANTVSVPPIQTGSAQSVLDGADLILSIDGGALAFSTGCKVSTSVEVGERVTKERAGGKWKEKYVKSFSEQITADQIIMMDGSAGAPSYDQLKAKMLSSQPVTAHYSLRNGDSRTGKAACGYVGRYLITQLDGDFNAGDDAKGSVTLQNCGPVEVVEGSGGISEQPTKYTMTFVKNGGSSTTGQYAAGEAIVYPANTTGYKWPDDKLTYMPSQNFSVVEVAED